MTELTLIQIRIPNIENYDRVVINGNLFLIPKSETIQGRTRQDEARQGRTRQGTSYQKK